MTVGSIESGKICTFIFKKLDMKLKGAGSVACDVFPVSVNSSLGTAWAGL